MHDQHDRGAEVGRDPGVERQLGAGRDVGVVRAEDQHDVEALGQPPEPLDDLVQRLVGVLAGLVVGDPERLLVGLARPRAGSRACRG